MPRRVICLVCGRTELEAEKFHCFPTNKEKCVAWLRALGCSSTQVEELRQARICNHHFSNESYVPFSEKKWALRKEAIPFPFEGASSTSQGHVVQAEPSVLMPVPIEEKESGRPVIVNDAVDFESIAIENELQVDQNRRTLPTDQRIAIIRDKLNSYLDHISTEAEVEALEKLIAPIEPTLTALKNQRSYATSTSTSAILHNKNIEPQRSLFSVKKKTGIKRRMEMPTFQKCQEIEGLHE